MIHRVDVEITTPRNPTEVRERVEAAIETLFPDAEIEERHGELSAETHSMAHVRERLREQAVLDTAREVFRENVRGEGFSFALKKQAALQDVVNFAVGNPDELGELHVRVRVEEPDVESFIDYLTAEPD